MPKFVGLFNDNGNVDDIVIHYEFVDGISDFFIGSTRTDIVINNNVCTIRGVEYDFRERLLELLHDPVAIGDEGGVRMKG